MINKNYIWKDISRSSRKLPLMIITVLVIFILLSVSGGYFLLYIPKKERLAQEQIAQQQVAQKLQQVKQYYLESLAGGHITSLNRLLAEIARSRVPLEMAGYQEENITCDITSCNFQYLLKDHAIFNLQLKKFWQHYFMANFSANEINYQGVPSKLENHPLLQKYQSADDILLPQCVNLLSYIHSHNTTVANKEKLTLLTAPESSISSVEQEIGLRLSRRYNLLSATWEIELPRASIYVMQYFKTLAYPDAFFIKEIAVREKGTKISGGLLCKNGH
ncbi:hypothetical protein [Ewingella americana]|uniref:hypothetical protein n=1 Tax=Ewingella americana TaxID=41202 RepID=UPI001639CB8B|nr:hypothetical protein [Ewingella americana]QMV52706.1 hypothetical protein GXP68_16180 [Ewingella americana]